VMLFPALNVTYLRQNEQVSTGTISCLSFLLKDPRAYKQLQSLFKQDEQGGLSVRFKVPEEFTFNAQETTDNFHYDAHAEDGECTFVFNSQQLNTILEQNYGIETNCLAVKILLFIGSLYKRTIPQNESKLTANGITAPEGFLSEILNLHPFITLSPLAINAMKKMAPELPIYVKLEHDNPVNYNDTNLIITEISATDEVILAQKMSDKQSIRYEFSELDGLNYSAWIYAPDVFENKLLNIISASSPEDLNALISYPELIEMIRLKLEKDPQCNLRAIKRVFMACEFLKIREAWGEMKFEERTSFLESLESGVKTNVEIISQFLVQNAPVTHDEEVSIEATMALLTQTIQFQKIMGNHEDCFFQSANPNATLLSQIAQISLQTAAEFNLFFNRERTLSALQQFNNFFELKHYNPKLALNLAKYSLEHSFELFKQFPEQIIAEINNHPKFNKWFASVQMAADSKEMASQHWVDFKKFIINQEIVFNGRDHYDIEFEAERYIEQLRKLRYKDFPDATLSELVESNKVSQVIIHAFQEKIKEIQDKSRDGILDLTIKELQRFTFNFHECKNKAQLDLLQSKLYHQIYIIVNHPLCAEIGRREIGNPSSKLKELHQVLKQTYERLEQEYQNYLAPFQIKLTNARSKQFNVARAQLNEELERLNHKDKNSLTLILNALDEAETMVFANKENPLDQNQKIQALDNILLQVEQLDKSDKRAPVIVRQINRAVDVLAAEVNNSDHPAERSVHSHGMGFFSQAHNNKNEIESVFKENIEDTASENASFSRKKD